MTWTFAVVLVALGLPFGLVLGELANRVAPVSGGVDQ